MSKDLEKFSQGATILQQVNVSDIFTSLALGIADAQEKLDDNSIRQARKLADTTFGDSGKSLLELGFVPTFYSFTHADISASLNLKMAFKDTLDFGFGVDANYDKDKSGSSKYSDNNSQATYKKEKNSFKSNRRFSMKLSSTEAIIINENHYKLDTSLDVFKRIEKFHSEVTQSEKIDRLRVHIAGEIASKYTPPTHTILKLTDKSDIGNDVDKNGDGTNDIIIKEKTFSDIFTASVGKYGFSGDKMHGLSSSATPIVVFFGFDKDTLDPNYKEGNYKNTEELFEALKALGDILKSDLTLKITIDGHTDSSGPDAYNISLSKRRCEAMRRFFIACGAKAEQIKINPRGETLSRENGPDSTKNPEFRKVSITLEAGKEYIYFDMDMDSASPTSGSNYFSAGLTGVIETDNFSHTNNEVLEIKGIEFGLAENTEIEFFAYSNSSEVIEIRAEEGAEEKIKVSENESRSESVDSFGNEKKSDSTFAISGSVDFRMSKQFEMSMEGNSSMSARLVAVPPPSAFLDELKP